MCNTFSQEHIKYQLQPQDMRDILDKTSQLDHYYRNIHTIKS